MPRQGQVASVVIDCFPEIPGMDQIRTMIFEASGELLTVVAIKRAWQEARNKIREPLVEAGYWVE